MSARRSVLFDAPGPVARRRIAIGNVVAAILVAALVVLLLMRLDAEGQLDADKWAPIFTADAWTNYLLPGLVDTLRAAALAIVGALVLGILLGIGRVAHAWWLRAICTVVVEFFRAVPVLLMMIFFWLLMAQQNVPDAPFWAVVLALVLYNGSVVAELVRSGVHGLPSGQREAALAVGLTRGQSLRSVEVPQALVAMLPALVSQLVVVLKDSALGYIITYTELLQESRRLGSANVNILQALTVAAVIFIVVNYTLTKIAELLARTLSSRTAGSTTTFAAGLENTAGGGSTLQADLPAGDPDVTDHPHEHGAGPRLG
ncbi:amino acid ABC transporter membrane protein 2 (PAAT family) [Sediminihabitans luteus]|uniref:Amino acid ABC transporter membrane protein 2 (PAAT family) n=1 Tax=Sediminihabitans luteus TaxID=1138585 RepID=A0A2M9CCJ3_9CELL|nr:amino acid ABC transporter permease [Sediminihabitans luteus]PJJ69043.1 amino acid ABC transporter membrane protein 2 (PAAT family) [Sediminihabitans luteus]GII99429.1 glutamate ABC transporter permease [Sediminihabitans luteus]